MNPSLPVTEPASTNQPDQPDRRIAFLVAAAFFMEFLDATAIITAVPAMATDFGVAPTALSTGISAYLLTLAVFIPLSGWVADRFGPKNVFAAAILLFTMASIACGFSTSLSFFVVARIFQGIGGALMVPVGRMVVLRNTPKSQLVKAIATITWPGLAAPVLGPPLGGWIASTWGWHWIFFINVPLGTIAIVLALRWISGRPGGRRPFDWQGFIFSGAGLASLLYGLELTTNSMISWWSVAAFEIVGMGLLVFALRQMRRLPNPLIDVSVLDVQTFRACIVGGSLSRIAIGSAPFLMPLMFQLAFGFSMVASGFMMLALFAGNLGMKPFTTYLLRRFGFRTMLIGNGVCVAIGFAACCLLSPDTPLYLMVIVMVFSGMCRSMQFTSIGTLAFSDTPTAQTGNASTLFSMFQQLSAGIGIAFAAVSLRIAEAVTGHSGHPGLTDFRIALGLVALLVLLSLIDARKLRHDAGARVSGHVA